MVQIAWMISRKFVITSATELEFWVKTPDDKGDREQSLLLRYLRSSTGREPTARSELRLRKLDDSR